MYGITEEHNADRRGGQALQNLCGRLCGILHKTNEWNGTEQGYCHSIIRQEDSRGRCGISIRLWLRKAEFPAEAGAAPVPGTGTGD